MKFLQNINFTFSPGIEEKIYWLGILKRCADNIWSFFEFCPDLKFPFPNWYVWRCVDLAEKKKLNIIKKFRS